MSQALPRLAVALIAAGSFSAHAADTLFWGETGPSVPFHAGPVYIKSGSLPGGPVGAIVSGVDSVKGPGSVEFLGGRVWWTDQQLGDIRSVKPDGSDLQVYGDGTLNPYDLDLVGNTIYWTDQNGSKIFTIDVDNEPWVSHLLPGSFSHPDAIDVVGSSIYWSEVAGVNRVRRANLDGSNAVTLLSGVDSRDIEVTDSYLYVTTSFGDVIRTGLDGSGATTLASGLGLITGIDVTDDAIYVAQYQFPGQIYRMTLDGSGGTQIYVAPDNGFINGVAVQVAVPEPSTVLLTGLGLLGIAAVARRRH